LNTSTVPIACRWKRLYGLGRQAVYRATCGRESCPGHLGDMSYTDSLAHRTASDLQHRRNFDELVRTGALPGVLTHKQAEARHHETEWIASQVAHLDLPQEGEWRMSAELLLKKLGPSDQKITFIGPGGYAFYRGYRDSGFHIALTGKRSRKGFHIARRPMEGVSRDLRIAGVSNKFIEGQVPRPTDRVWCRVCGQLNQLDWPDALKDPEAR
jgi:hypothetical protein